MEYRRLGLASRPDGVMPGDLAKLAASAEQEEDALQTVLRVLLYQAEKRRLDRTSSSSTALVA